MGNVLSNLATGPRDCQLGYAVAQALSSAPLNVDALGEIWGLIIEGSG